MDKNILNMNNGKKISQISSGIQKNNCFQEDYLQENDNDQVHNHVQLPVLITSGEPAGIGMDIILDLASQDCFSNLAYPIIVTACHKSMLERLIVLEQNLEKSLKNNPNPSRKKVQWQVINQLSDLKKPREETDIDFYLLDIATNQHVIAGQINISNASMVIEQLKIAHQLAIEKKIAGIVTAPLQKSALIDAKLTLPDGTMFSGHTEYFMQMSRCHKVVMMLANSKLKVALVTTHVPLSHVAQVITSEAVRDTVQIVLDSVINQYKISQPKILVCGLNPHAGEGGHLGMEEIEIINPVLQEFIDNGHDVSLSMPADTLFTERYLANCDATIAMYHDQGLPVLKSHGFGDSVNVTLGLPYIRTSVDHGTALDLAGSGLADSGSLKQAIDMLSAMC